MVGDKTGAEPDDARHFVVASAVWPDVHMDTVLCRPRFWDAFKKKTRHILAERTDRRRVSRIVIGVRFDLEDAAPPTRQAVWVGTVDRDAADRQAHGNVPFSFGRSAPSARTSVRDGGARRAWVLHLSVASLPSVGRLRRRYRRGATRFHVRPHLFLRSATKRSRSAGQ